METRVIKIAFFDIDGTLLSFKTHRMPESSARALAALRANGVRTVISTGRVKNSLPPELLEGFDTYLTLNGQLCFDGEGVFRSCPLDDADVRAVLDQAAENGYAAMVLQESGSFVTCHTDLVLANERQVGLTYREDDPERAFDEPVYQMCAFVGSEDDHLITDATEHMATTRWTELFCDVVPDQGGKDFGVRAALERYGLTAEEAIAFGDGENDLSMLKAVGIGVAMGNAWDIVKEHADYVTTGVDDDGIWNACEHFGLV